jgi:hypothetical protein
MPATDHFRVASASPDNETGRLFYEGREVGMVSGSVLESQWRVGDQWLLFLTHDCPFEEGLSIDLLSKEFEVLDRVSLGIVYSTGRLRDVVEETDNRFEFSFFAGDDRWDLRILREPVLRVGIPLVPVGVRFHLKDLIRRRHLLIRQIKK